MTFKRVMYLLLFALPVGAILRILQYYLAIDPQTGYYEHQSITVTLLYLYIAICFVVFLSPLRKKENKIQISQEYIFSISTFEIILCFIAAALYFVYTVIFPFREIYTETGKIDTKNFFLFLFGVLTAIYFILLALKDKQFYQKTIFKFISLCPVAFFLVKLVSVFNQLTMEASVSAYTLELIELAAFVFFFMNLAKFLLNGTNVRQLFIYGLWSVTSVAIASIPPVLLPVLPGELYRSSQPPILEIMYILTGIFIFMFIRKISRYEAFEPVEQLEDTMSEGQDFLSEQVMDIPDDKQDNI